MRRPRVHHHDAVRDACDLIEVVAADEDRGAVVGPASRLSRRRMTPAGSSAFVGSSSTMMLGSCCRAAASPTRCLLPSDKCANSSSGVLLEGELGDDVDRPPRRRRATSAESSTQLQIAPRRSAPDTSAGTRPGDPTCAHVFPVAAASGYPGEMHLAASGRSIPRSTRIRVDLPAPFRPTSATIRPEDELEVEVEDARAVAEHRVTPDGECGTRHRSPPQTREARRRSPCRGRDRRRLPTPAAQRSAPPSSPLRRCARPTSQHRGRRAPTRSRLGRSVVPGDRAAKRRRPRHDP